MRFYQKTIMFLFAALALLVPVHAAKNIQVLAIHAYSQEYPWTKSQHQGFINQLGGSIDLPVTVSTEYLDTKRIQYTAEYAELFADYLGKKYSEYTPDLVYVTDDNGYLFARDQLLSLFPSSPVFFSGVNNFEITCQGSL